MATKKKMLQAAAGNAGGAGLDVDEVFSTYLYKGNGSTQTITNGIDLDGEGGLVWIKTRSNAEDHKLFDSGQTAVTYALSSNNADASSNRVTSLTSFNSNGFSLGSQGEVNELNYTFASWTFRKAPKFFDVVTWDGNNTAGREIAHNLGTTVGTIIVKCTSRSSTAWTIYHRSSGSGKYLEFDTGAEGNAGTGYWNATEPTSSVFTLGNDGNVNATGRSYVAYLFAHDTAADSMIQCGSYTGGGNNDVEVNLGWKPQWLLVRRSDATEDWFIVDTARGLGADGDPNALLEPNLNDLETSNSTRVAVTDTGFFTTANTGSFNASGGTYIYVAIRAASDLDITWPSSIEFAGGIAPAAPATGETDIFTFSTDDGGTSYIGTKTADNLS
jgi:hypothetical protein